MSEWDVFVAVSGILAFCVTVYKICVVFNNLNTSVQVLIGEAKRLSDEMRETREDNKESHRRIWAHNDLQDKQLNDHEKRISIIEKEMEE